MSELTSSGEATPPVPTIPPPRPPAAIEQSPSRGRRLDTLGWVAVTLGAVLTGSWSSDSSSWGSLVVWLTGIGLTLFGVWAVLHGRRHLKQVLPSLRALPADERIVLWLRSFSDDDAFSRTAAWRFRGLRALVRAPTAADFRTEEDQVVRALAPFGRMVGLGQPSDQLPPLGADRAYASDGTWRAEVLSALDRAGLVVLAAGEGRSLSWEVEQVVRRLFPTRLVLVVGRDRRRYEDFKRSLGNLFPKGLPNYPQLGLRQRLLPARSIRAVIWFDPDWTPHLRVLAGRVPMIGFARRTQRALRRALRPVYERARVPVRPTPRTARPWAVKLGVAVVLVLGLAPEVWFAFAAGSIQDALDQAAQKSPLHATSSEPFSAFTVLTAWPLWVWWAGLAAWMWRVWRGGPLAVTLARVWGVWFPLVVLASLVTMALAPKAGLVVGFVGLVMYLLATQHLNWIVPSAVGLLGLSLLAIPLVAALLVRRDVREWVDSRL